MSTPAWKRLGLKLKAAGSDSAAANSFSVPPPVSSASPSDDYTGSYTKHSDKTSTTTTAKRKQPPGPPLSTISHPKRARKDERPLGAVMTQSQGERRKSVTFADGTNKPSKTAAQEAKRKEKKTQQREAPAEKEKKKAQKQSKVVETDLSRALEYLHQWHTARERWKFNKNLQALLIKYVFTGTKLPSADINVFYEYIHDLHGFSRQRLIDSAREIQTNDGEPDKDTSEEKAQAYRDTICELIASRAHSSPEKNKKRKKNQEKEGSAFTFDEEAFTNGTTETDVKLRVIRRMRAEMVLATLGTHHLRENDESTGSTVANSPPKNDNSKPPAATMAVSKSKESPQTAQAPKRVRLRKRRGADMEDDKSSSNSSSDSEYDTDSKSDSDKDSENSDSSSNNSASSSSSSE